MDKIKIVIADDQVLFRQAIGEVIRNTEDMELLMDADNGRMLLDGMATLGCLPDIALIDLQMPEMNGVELKEQLERLYPTVRTIVLTVLNQERFISRLLASGANGYVHKDCNINELVLAIRTVHKSGFYFNDSCINALRNAARYTNRQLKSTSNIPLDLTERERDVLLLLCKELATAEIAERLYISARTVEGHRINLLAKTGCKNTAGLVVFAIKNGLYEPWFN